MVTKSIRSVRCRRRWKGYQVTTMDEVASQGDIFVTATGNIDVITIDDMRR